MLNYPMEIGTDFQRRTNFVNFLRDTIINQTRRLFCYSQVIYDDLSLELDEYAGLTLGVDSGPSLTTITTNVKPFYNQSSILILDNDSEFISLGICIARFVTTPKY